MNNKYNTQSKNMSKRALIIPSKQKGMALMSIVLIMLTVVSLASLSASKTTILETKMVFNMQDKQRSLLAADSAALYGWEQIRTNVNIKNMINNSAHAGYYVLGDKVPNTAKSGVDWNALENVVSWPWDNIAKRFEIPAQLGGAKNPMKLLSKPQYIAGMHNSILRKGSADQLCIPMSIIGASKGGVSQTRTLIELKAIPTSTCYFEKIK